MTSIAQTIRQSCNQVLKQPPASRPGAKTRVVPARIRLLGVGFNLAAKLNLEWTAQRLSEFWFRVFKPSPRQWVHGFWSAADHSVELNLHDKTIPLYLWGSGPLVVCMHGWAGSGTQFRRMIPALVEAGYRVACFDAPAHGMNPGSKTHIMEFSQALLAINEQVAPVHTVIAHSFGAMATLMAGYHGLAPAQTVMLAPGLDVQEIFDSYSNALRLDDRLAQRFRAHVGEKMAAIAMVEDPWDFFSPQPMLRYAAERKLMIYDEDDDEISSDTLNSIAASWTDAETIVTQKLGHNGILKDAAVIGRVVDWLRV